MTTANKRLRLGGLVGGPLRGRETRRQALACRGPTPHRPPPAVA
jgi:hypothetical protein